MDGKLIVVAERDSRIGIVQAPEITQNLLAAEPLNRSHGAIEGDTGTGITGGFATGLEMVFESLAGLHITATCGEPDALLYDFNGKMKVSRLLQGLATS